MKITLTKLIKVKNIEFIGEVDFYEDDSPYVKLLENISSEYELVDHLENKGMSDAAIKNVVGKLTSLGVIGNGYIQNIRNGFPEKEYGKYSLAICENNTYLPFKYKNKEIKRIDAKPWQKYINLKEDRNIMELVKDDSNNDYKVLNIENKKANITEQHDIELKIIYENNWRYVVDNKSFDMSEIDFNALFDGNWDQKTGALKVNFVEISGHPNAIESMEHSFKDSMSIEQYGELTAYFKNIPVMPKTFEDAKLWFLHILKTEIEVKNRYISKEELQSLWSNLMDKKPRFQIFNLIFDFNLILQGFGKDSKYYWLLQATIHLYPFANKLHPKNRVIIQDGENVDLKNHLFNAFNIKKPQKLVIVDRWIVNLKQYEALEKIIEAFGFPETTIVTQEVKERKNESKINDIIQRIKIKKLVKAKKDIVHQRYWIIDDNYYQTSESLDFITLENDNVRTKYTTFELYEHKDIDPALLKMEIN